jgi:SAM-dependent methyltransferase
VSTTPIKGLRQRGRAGLQLLGALQAYSSSELLAKAKADFSADPESEALREEFKRPARENEWTERLARARAVAATSKAFRHNRFFQRWVAEELYRRALPATEARRAFFTVTNGEQVPSDGRSTLLLNPDFELPDWYAGVEWHLQVGGYDGYDLASPMFVHAIGPHVFSRGGYAAVPVGADIREHRARVIAQLRNRNPARFYEMGCGGAMTLGAARQQFPDAELIGGDLNVGLLKSGHAASLAMGLGITFRQEDACRVAEADNSIDAVISFAVYHEMPRAISAQTMREMFRILKPGGEMIISDPPPLRAVSPFEAVLLDWETENRAEPFFTEMATADLGQMMRDAGFEDVSERSLDDHHPYPWVTYGVKPTSV